ncbi:MAG: polysaccharide deacetylase family protein, partial [Candidatus Bathyarchaeia archaeon]
MSKHIKLLINKNFINFIIIASIFIIAIIWSIFCEIPLTYSNEFKKKVCIFFDDGWKNQFDVALPVLKDFGFKATFSIITDYIV